MKGAGTSFVVAWGFGRYAPEASAGIPVGMGNRTEPPPKEAGGLGPRPFHEEISALWFQAERTGPQAMAALSLYIQPLFNAGNHP